MERNCKRMHRERGRTMIEMLAVLGIIALVSIAGITGYRAVISRYRANQTISEIGSRAAVGASQLRMGQELNDAEFGARTGMGYAARFETGPDARGFDVVLSGVPADICARIVDAGWNAPLAVYVGTDEAEVSSGGREEADAADICAEKADAGGLVAMAFLFEGNKSGSAVSYVRCADSWDCAAADCCFRGACVPRADGACDDDSDDDDTPPPDAGCPAGTQKVGNLCVKIVCPQNQELVGSTCVDCPPERPVWTDGKCYASGGGGGECPDGQRKVGGACCIAKYDGILKKWVCCAGDLVPVNTGTPGYVCCGSGQQAVDGTCCEAPDKLAALVYGGTGWKCCASGAARRNESGETECCAVGEWATRKNDGITAYMCCPVGQHASSGVCCPTDKPAVVTDPAVLKKICCPAGSGGAANGTCCPAGQHGVRDAAAANTWQCCPQASGSAASGQCCPSGKNASATEGQARCCQPGETLRNVDGEYLCCAQDGGQWKCNSCATDPLKDSAGDCHLCDAVESVDVSWNPNACLACGSHRTLFRHDGIWWCGLRSCPADKPLQDKSGDCFSCAASEPIDTNNCAVCPGRVMQDGMCKPACPEGQFWSTYGACYSCDEPIDVPSTAAQCALCPQRERSGYDRCVLTTCPDNKPLRDLGGSMSATTYSTYIKGCYACGDGRSITTYESECQTCGNRQWNLSGWPSGGPGLCTLSCLEGEGIWDVADLNKNPYCRSCNYQQIILMDDNAGWGSYSSQSAAQSACEACGRYFITKSEPYCCGVSGGVCVQECTQTTFICSLTPCSTCGDNWGCSENTFPVVKDGRDDYLQCRSCDEPLLLGEDGDCSSCPAGKRNEDCSLKTCAAGTYNPNSQYNAPPCVACPANVSGLTETLCTSCGRWYNDACCPAFSALTTAASCAACGGYWEGGACLADCPTALDTLTTDETCWLCGGDWEDGACGCPPLDALFSAASCEYCGGHWFNGACLASCPSKLFVPTTAASCAGCGGNWTGTSCCPPAQITLTTPISCAVCGGSWIYDPNAEGYICCPVPLAVETLTTAFSCYICGGYWVKSGACLENCPADITTLGIIGSCYDCGGVWDSWYGCS
ncbi:MAG: type II secretion system protein [Alphaproteobacteria bacterium]|nr:type II secretion system protein [Alphaproteobacteria bacterium]